MSIRVRPCVVADEAAWDEFVLSHKHGSPFHLTGWKKSIQATFRFEPRYLLAERDGRLEGVLPLFLVDTFLTGRVLLSTPFAVYGGILANSDEARDALREEAERLGKELRVQYIELRNAWNEQCAGWPQVDRYVTFTTAIAQGKDAILQSLPRETRRMTRRALEHKFEVTRTRDLGQLDHLYGANLRKLGTPAFPRRHFAHLLKNFPDADIREIRLDGQVAAVVLSLHFRDTVLPYYGASDPALNRANPNNFMYYDLMCWAAAQGLRVFDFGRSKKGSGSYAFKSHWGMEERTLPYEFFLVKRREIPNFSPANPKYGLAIRLWQHVPLKLTRILGPLLIRQFP